ncbi:MAG: nodulation protein NfeD [Candidatus Omnitrophica bacterium]|nr:nodulation protein NfeD [Candidatus Omnitrophota bacterium]
MRQDTVRASTGSARTMGALFLLLAACASLSAEEQHPVLILKVAGIIDPALARYVTRGLEEARQVQASAVVIELDTPGGLDGSMRKIVQGILNSPVPVIVTVSPSGARAASAGVFITLSAHVAAMAPGTNIGAAHPVQLGGAEKPSSPMEEKLTNDAVAYIHSIADVRDRNSEWAEESVRQSRSSTAEEAKENKVIDLIAKDLDDLIEKAEGRLVKTVSGVTTLALKGKPHQTLPMSLMEKVLHPLAHPNLAYILLLLGIYGLIYELATPGAVFPGVLGALFLVLALVALETLEVNWAGLLLIILSLIFFIADIKLPGYGALSIGGIAAFLIGSAFLFPGARLPHLKLPWGIIGAATGVTAAFFLGIVGAGIRALGRKVISGAEALIGAVGVAKTDLKPGGFVHVQGEEWQARSDHPIKKGMRVRIVKVEGLTIHVEPIKEDS